ncbi:hypothetical protein GGQ87_002673 [Brevundimonas alba]|uniref:DUF5076 domain-containing protein n=1 Tax=Brevundimonas alba TaxID=74314 RepID=A0A7X5YLY7_9CAUL|nr:DUF5076 domain-containing protein [Brevundimonas alba]NJC42378.1 hypothetical protein [Brevundimonas alba]
MSEPEQHQLKTPDSVAADPEAIEIMRMWWSKQEPVMSIKPAFNDPAMFGRMLAYAATHMAHGYNVRHGVDERIAYNQILAGLSDALKAQNVQTITEPTGTGGAQ